ncbi:ATP-binding protein [Actinokineospora auranticolor]|uniref:Anti-sigma regulatory factor (Ser/Thr protein kinase) n=1 Tax=Actinokineospora auranticolor TaxID=155976 RepID=A0A2S6GIJ2_9PSEU|nr:ATP-binding protein [Actinokineospora auranticolor]PPK65054.1 anti-sigma regulatory factor (Ser/Thr protein kinase) [Actinokineospora auranticolor]
MTPGTTTPRTSALRVEITAHIDDITVIRAALRAWLTARDIVEARREDILLAIDEAITNSIEHAYRDIAPGPVTLTALVLPDATSVRVSIADRGQWRTPTSEPSGTRVPLSGRGLKIIYTIADRLNIDRGTPTAPGTTTTIEFRAETTRP